MSVERGVNFMRTLVFIVLNFTNLCASHRLERADSLSIPAAVLFQSVPDIRFVTSQKIKSLPGLSQRRKRFGKVNRKLFSPSHESGDDSHASLQYNLIDSPHKSVPGDFKVQFDILRFVESHSPIQRRNMVRLLHIYHPHILRSDPGLCEHGRFSTGPSRCSDHAKGARNYFASSTQCDCKHQRSGVGEL